MVSPRELAVVLTRRCNLACTYCRQRPTRHGTLSFGDLTAAVDLLAAGGADRVHVGFTGGEPLLEFPLLRSAVEYAERSLPPSVALSFRVLTNATRLCEPIASFLEAHGIRAQLSLDGVPAAQDARCPGTSPRVERALSRLRRHHPAYLSQSVTAAMTVTPRTVPHLEASVRSLVEGGIRDIRVAPANGARGWRAGDLAALDGSFLAVYRFVLDHYLDTGDVPFAPFRKWSHTPVGREAGHWICGAPRGRKLALDADGSLAACVVATRTYLPSPAPAMRPAVDALRMGTAEEPLDEQVARIQRHAEAVGVFTDNRRRYSSYGRCVDCEYGARCLVCPLTPAFERKWDDPFRVPDFVCAFRKVTFKYHDRFPPQPPPSWGRHDPPGASPEVVRAPGRGSVRGGDTC